MGTFAKTNNTIMRNFAFLFIVLSLAFTSCSEENVYDKSVIDGKTTQVSNSKFLVEKTDIEKLLTDFFHQPAMTRTNQSFPKIISIDPVKTNLIATRSSSSMNIPDNLLYFVKLADSSTVIVSGDKRAEPIYAHFKNIDLKINGNGELDRQDSLPDMVIYLIENYIVDVKNKTKDNDQLNSYYADNQGVTTRSGNSKTEEIQPKLAYRFTDAYKYNESNRNYNLFTSQDIKPWTIHALCVAIPDYVEIRSFDNYKLKASWKKAKKLNVIQLQGDLFHDFVAMSNKIPLFNFFPDSEISAVVAFNAIKNFFSGADGIPSLSYDRDWYNMLNNLRLETGISYISGFRDRKHPTFFRRTSYHNPGFFLADGYKKIGNDYYIHVVGPIGNKGIVSGYILDFNRNNAGRFEHTHWKEWYGTPYKTAALNIHTTKYLPQ